jgi:hypothetical protein
MVLFKCKRKKSKKTEYKIIRINNDELEEVDYWKSETELTSLSNLEFLWYESKDYSEDKCLN